MIKPLPNNILIKRKEKNNTSKSGIILSTKSEESLQFAEVIEVGQGITSVKKGDNVMFSKYAGTDIRYEGIDYVVVKQEDILATY